MLAGRGRKQATGSDNRKGISRFREQWMRVGRDFFIYEEAILVNWLIIYSTNNLYFYM